MKLNVLFLICILCFSKENIGYAQWRVSYEHEIKEGLC